MAINGFTSCTLNDIAEFRNGKGLSQSFYLPYGKYPVFGSSGEITRTDELLNPSPVITIGRVGAFCGSVYRVNMPSWVTDNAIVAIPKKDIDFNFLYYRLKSLALNRTAIGSAQPLVTQGGLKLVKTVIPPLPEQKAIASILGDLDDKIELNRKINETLEAMARTVFKSWFVDFDPVRAKAEGRETGLPKGISDLFPDSFEDSELGRIPRGWQVQSIENLAERVAMGPFGSSIKVSTFVPDGIPVISGQHLNQTLLEDNHYNFITPSHAEKLKNANVFRGDVVFTHAGNIGQVAYIPETSRYERYVISQRQFYMRCDLKRTSPLFIVYFFKMPEGQHKLLANTSSTGVPSISRPVSYLRTIKLTVPKKPLTNAFDKLIHSLHLQVSNNITQSKNIATIRDTLLPKLLSGEIRVKDMEKFVEEVV